MAMKADGMGWGKIAKSLDVHPGKWGTNLGGIVSGKPKESTTPSATEFGPKGKDNPSNDKSNQKNDSAPGNSGDHRQDNDKGKK